MRRRIYEIIERSWGNDFWSRAYDRFMIIVIIISLIPLAFKQDTALFRLTDSITVCIFIIDYILHFITADFKYSRRYGKKSIRAFIKYPFSFWAVVDLLAILPSITLLSDAFRLLKILRMFRAMRVIRVFKAMRYSKSFQIIRKVLRSSADSLIAVCVLAAVYILVAALVIYNVEPESFQTFFDAIYWATVSLTTVGYGDIYPVSTVGRIVAMFSSVFGIAIVALPSGIITAGYMSEIENKKS